MPASEFDASNSHRKLAALVCAALLMMLAAFACGASGEPVATESVSADEEGLRLVTRAEAFYTVDDLTAVGYKKSKQFGVAEVPGATDIWYGFFQQKDIEVRFYESHSDALEMGVELAEVIIGRKAGQRDALIPVVNLYPAYAVVGNTVMLCERQLSTCEALIAVLE